jgi:hypothetical protein
MSNIRPTGAGTWLQHLELAQRLGVLDIPGVEQGEPTTPLDTALQWQKRGLVLFPGKRHTGTPLVGNWNTVHNFASNNPAKIIEWWSEWPTADIGAVPDSSGRFVMSACKQEGGLDSLDALEDELGELPAEFSYENHYGDMFLWFPGSTHTSHHKIGQGLHLLGPGNVVFLPDSFTPHLDYTTNQ